MTNTTDMGNYHTCFHPRVSHMFVLRVKVQYTIIHIIFAEMKGDGFKMTKPGGEISADREKDKSKTKANDWAEDAKLENYSEGKLYYALC